MQALLELDGQILLWIQENVRQDFLTPLVILITRFGDGGYFWMGLIVALLIPKKTRRIGVIAMISLLVSFLFNNVFLKNVVARTRPYEVVEGLTRLIEAQPDYSFPSGHSCNSFVVASAITWASKNKKPGICLMIFAGLIALSRLYVGVHYPTDVICGTISGICISVIVYQVFIRIEKKLEKKAVK